MENLPEYVIEAWCLCTFMVSASLFGVLLFHPASPAFGINVWLRNAIAGAAMGSTAIAIICSPWGKRSGAHFSPAVTLTFFRLGKINGRDAAFYIVSQFIGGVTGILIAWVFLGDLLSDRAVNFAMALALLVVNGLIMMRMAPAMATRVDDLPRAPDLARFVAVESVTTAVASSLTAFLPVLVTQRLGSTAGGHFYVPWVITTMVSLLLSSTLIAMVRELVDNPAQSQSALRRSLGMSGLVVVVAMLGCVVAAPMILWPLGPDFVEHGVPLLRWAGLALPGSAVTLLFWSACLVERRAWPILWMNLAISVGMLAGVLTLDAGDSPSSVGMLYCLVQTAVAVAVARPTVSALRRLRARRHPEMSARPRCPSSTSPAPPATRA